MLKFEWGIASVACADARVTRCHMSNIAPHKLFYALIRVILIIKLQIRWLPVKVSQSPFTHNWLIFLGNYLPKHNYENRETGWVRILHIKCHDRLVKLGGSGYYILSATTGWVSYADRLQRRHRNCITIQYYLSLKIVCKIKLQTNDIVTLLSFSWCVDVILHSVLFWHVARASI